MGAKINDFCCGAFFLVLCNCMSDDGCSMSRSVTPVFFVGVPKYAYPNISVSRVILLLVLGHDWLGNTHSSLTP